jgi:hypothetical protein
MERAKLPLLILKTAACNSFDRHRWAHVWNLTAVAVVQHPETAYTLNFRVTVRTAADKSVDESLARRRTYQIT